MSELTKLRDELRKEMRDFEAKMERDLRKELRDMKASLDFFNKEYEKAKTESFELAKINKALKASNDKLVEECRALKKQASQLEDRVTASEQYSRNRNLEIKGVPLTKDDNICEIVRQVGDALAVPIEEAEIEVCHRVPVKNPSAPPNIVVQFKSRTKRDAVLKKAKKMRISTEDLGFSPNSPLYINEHLCPALKQLLGMAIEQKKAKGWRFVWSCDGKILARKEESSPIVHIRNAQDVEKIA